MENYTQFKDVNEVLETLVSSERGIFGADLVGIYVYGSLIWGDFNCERSDIDILVAIKNEVSHAQFENLEIMHSELISQFPAWHDRLDIAYVSLYLLKNFKNATGKIAVISPGEDFNSKEAGRDWLVNYYLVQNNSITLYGPKPDTIIEPISEIEFINNVKDQAMEWKNLVTHTKDSIGFQYYAVLTLCRVFYVLSIGKQASKLVAGTWMLERFPKWYDLIARALSFQEYPHTTNYKEVSSNYIQVRSFVNEIVGLIQKKQYE